MIKKLTYSVLILCLILMAAGSSYLFLSEMTEKQYNKIMCYFIARNITEGKRDFYEKIDILRDFVHENVLPIAEYPNRLDTCAIEKLISGIGWCDQSSRVFMSLARSLCVTTRLLMLKLPSGSSPHAIAEALAPDGRWVIVDSLNKLDLRNKNGDFATQADIQEDFGVIENNERVKLRAKYEKLWYDKEYLSMYVNKPEYIITKVGSKVDFLRFIPVKFLKPIVSIINERYLTRLRSDTSKAYEFKMAQARTYHLLNDYEKAKALYDEIIEKSNNPLLAYKAEYYNAILLKDRKEYGAALRYIGALLDKDKENPYIKYLHGLRARILLKIERPEEAEKDLVSVKYDLEA